MISNISEFCVLVTNTICTDFGKSNIKDYIRLIARSFIMIRAVLSRVHSPYWLIFTAFVGANLFQSALTKWCLMEDVLRGLKIVKRDSEG